VRASPWIEHGAKQKAKVNPHISTAVSHTLVIAHSLTLAFQRDCICLLTPVFAFQGQEVVPLLKFRVTM